MQKQEKFSWITSADSTGLVYWCERQLTAAGVNGC